MDDHSRHAHERTVRLYPWYAFLSNTYFWMPVFFLFFLTYLPLEQVLLLEAIYYAGVVLLEVPSGYFSDRVGRRPTLIISTLSLVAAYALFFTSSSFLPLAVAQVLLATGLSFNSGTDTSLHYDALAALGREEEYGPREAMVSKLGFYAGALGAVGGGVSALHGLHMAYLLSLIASAGAFLVVLAMKEPATLEKKLLPPGGFFAQTRRVAARVAHPVVGYVFAFYVLMTILNHVPYEFYQPYIKRLLISAEVDSGITPLLTGLHVALAMLIASWFAGRSIRLRDRIGLWGVFLLAAGLQTLLIGSMALVTSWIIVALLLSRSIPRALMTAPINATVAPLFDKEQRATYFSLQSLAGRLAFSITLVLFSVTTGVIPGDPMKVSLAMGAVIGLIGIIFLGMTRTRVASLKSNGVNTLP
jgi:MFS family permease